MMSKDEHAAPKTIYLRDYRPPDHLVDTVDLDFNLHPTATRVRSRLVMRPNPAVDTGGRALVLDGEELSLEEIKLNGRKLASGDYEVDERALTIANPPAEPFELEITTFCNPESNKALSGLYRSRGIFCTQCEAEGFRRITYFPDRPDILARYRTRIQADAELAPVLLSNGNPVERGGPSSRGVHYAVWEDPHPKPSYLFALVGGDLACVSDSFTTMSGRDVLLHIYVEPGKEDRCAWAMESLKASMRWEEERWGREYDLDIFMIVAVSDFNMGAMENKGLNIFNDKLILARPDTATDRDYEAIEAVIAHEYFHNWTGNRVTCRDWFQLCLKEGLTVFRDQEFTSDLRSRPVKRISDVRMLKTHQFPEDSGPLAHPVRPSSYIEINNFYTATVYEKGAELCRMIQTVLGSQGFRKGMDLYFERHDGQAATVEDFLAAMADANGRDLAAFMTWYEQAGTPELACSLSYDASSATAELTVTQMTPPTPGQPRKKPLPIPLRLGLLGSNGDDLPLTLDTGEKVENGLVMVTGREQTFRFTGITSRPIPSLLRDFSAPVKLTTNLDEAALEFLMANDSDPFNRWQAGQEFAMRLLKESVAAVRAGRQIPSPSAYAGALAATAGDESLEAAYRAEVLKIPSESDIAREIGQDVDPDAIRAAREAFRAGLGEELQPLLRDLYEANEVAGPYSPDAASAGRRALRGTALGLLAATGDDAEIARCTAHYRGAQNMTDTINALSVLAQVQGPACEEALADFYERWKEDHLVIDKWFALQATMGGPQALERAQRLSRHPLFSIKNPNKVRALYGAFANMNPTGFNRADGAGYAFVADAILEIDRFNPQIAARLAGAFKSWRMLEPERRKQAEQTLKRIAGTQKLSRDTYEIVTKTLE
ncbi:MAG: aminopeptidase N [Methyloligellaceae bacterium]